MNRSQDEVEEGSAVVEFVLIAIPLFIPALLFFMAISSVAMEEMKVENLARQTLRAFVTADSISEGHQRITYVLDRYSEIESKAQRRYGFTYNLSCSNDYCLTPGTKLRIELFRKFGEEASIQRNSGKYFSGESNPGSGNSGSGNSSSTYLGQSELQQSRKAVAVATGIVDKWRE
ncbi:MAG: TadE/TadG family type IV pilus assembly protein [Actinomycetota bacterium]